MARWARVPPWRWLLLDVDDAHRVPTPASTASATRSSIAASLHRESARWVREHRELYAQAVFQGFEVTRPTAKE